MSFARAVKRRVKATLPPLFFLSLVAYFTWNTNQGEHGRRSYAEQLQLLARAKAEESAALSERAAWDQRVSGLKDRSLEADTLDERARAMLNLAHPDDLVVPYGRNRLY